MSSVSAGTDIFDNVSSAEASAGETSYRCVYIRNGTGSGLTAQTTKVWISDPNNTGGAGAYAGDTITIGLGKTAITNSLSEQTIANETTAPADTVTFVSAADFANALTIGDLAPGFYKAIWIRRVISAGATAVNNAGFTITTRCDTVA
jgi:hypothetical protein